MKRNIDYFIRNRYKNISPHRINLIKNIVAQNKIESILELGCGNGSNIKDLVIKKQGIDLNAIPPYIRGNIREIGWPKTELVFTAGVLCYFSNPRDIIKRMLRYKKWLILEKYDKNLCGNNEWLKEYIRFLHDYPKMLRNRWINFEIMRFGPEKGMWLFYSPGLTIKVDKK